MALSWKRALRTVGREGMHDPPLHTKEALVVGSDKSVLPRHTTSATSTKLRSGRNRCVIWTHCWWCAFVNVDRQVGDVNGPAV
ncbi:hypothetical protein HYQ44_019239 [Verticillium longisporum]|nr:hypothetical protein HYQ44_019239 [Verticillium longisporum]